MIDQQSRLNALPRDRHITWRVRYTQHGSGPYWLVAWTEQGEHHDVYLGKDKDGLIARYRGTESLPRCHGRFPGIWTGCREHQDLKLWCDACAREVRFRAWERERRQA